jgi:hypothetical protein
LGAIAIVAGILVYRASARLENRSQGPNEWLGTVVQVQRAGGGQQGLEACASSGSACRPAPAQSEISLPSQVNTDERTRANVSLGDKTGLWLDRSTKVRISSRGERRLHVLAGSAVVDANDAPSNLNVQVPGGAIDVGTGKVAVTADAHQAVIDVAHGDVLVIGKDQQKLKVHAGEQVRIVDGRVRARSANPAMAEELAWCQAHTASDPSTEPRRGLGELKAKKPGANDELRGAVQLAAHSVQVRIVSSFARTQVEETFVNNTDDVLEGIYRFPLPADAKIERLALDVDGRMVDGAFVERDRAAAIWRGAIVHATPVKQRTPQDDIVWVPGPWRDPALLEWQRGGRFELRIYPIPKRGQRRVAITYTQVSNPAGDVRRYTYPLAYDPSGASTIGQFDLDVQVRGNDPEYGVRSLGYAARHDVDSGVTRLSLSENGFVPHGDVVLEYALPRRDVALSAWAFNPGQVLVTTAPPRKAGDPSAPHGYAALSVRPTWAGGGSDVPRDVIAIVDTSRSMLGENLKRAQRVAARVLAELGSADRGSVLTCDTTCEVLPAGLISAGSELADAAARFLESKSAEGASDPTAAVRAGLVLGDRGRADRPLSIVYIGDGTPTVGPIRPGTVEKAIEHEIADTAATVVAVGVGGESDTDTLSAIARGGKGVAVNFSPGKNVDEIAYEVLAAVRGSHLNDVSVSLPEGLVDMAPRRPDPIRSGAELWLTARMQKPNVHGDVVLRGRLGKTPFEQRWALDLASNDSGANAFVPRLFAAARITDLERMGDADARREVIELSQKHHVASRYTSLLVLESEAMFKAFRLTKADVAQEWTGETEDEQLPSVAENSPVLPATGGTRSSAASRASEDKAYPSVASGRMSGAAAPKAATASADLRNAMKSSIRGEGSDAPAPSPPSDISQPSLRQEPSEDEVVVPRKRPAFEPRHVMIPMRRVWERRGTFSADHTPPDANLRALTGAEDALDRDPERRGALKGLLALYRRRNELDHADLLIGRWMEKEPLDADALTARADSAASRGKRDDAIRQLGSVVDARPDDVKAQQRLARLHRWSGEVEQSCRYWIALSEFHPDKPEWLVQAIRCSQAGENAWMGDFLLSNAAPSVRQQVERELTQGPAATDTLSGDLRVEAAWSGDADIDIAFITPEGQRVSWLGAPTRQVITARGATSRNSESLAMRNAPAGSYVIELVRVAGSGTARGELALTVADLRRSVPFTLRDERLVAGVASIRVTPKLVPYEGRAY